MMNIPHFLRSVAIAVGLTVVPTSAAPVISSITPSSSPSQGGVSITINGTGFGASSSALLGGSIIAISSANDTRIIGTIPAGEGAGRSVVVFASGQASSPVNFDYSPPSITAVTPAIAPTNGGTIITLTGSSFGINSTLTLNGASITPITRSHTFITFAMPAGQGSGLPIVVTAATQASPAASISYSPPVITNVTPASGPSQGGSMITITGSNFGLSRAVTIGTNPASVISGSHTQLVVMTPAGEGINKAVKVTTGQQVSNSSSFSYAPPQITGITPAAATTAGGVQITLTGSSFGVNPVVDFNGDPIVPSSASHTQVVFTLPPGQGTNLPVFVTADGQSSPPISFSYSPPLITSISPTSAATKGGTRMTIIGSNFGVSPEVRVGTKLAPLVSASHTQLEVTLPAGEGINQVVTVQTGGQTSNSQSFSYDPPVLSSVTASAYPTAGGEIITLTGSNFGLNPSVSIGGIQADLVPGSVDHESILCVLPEGQGVNREVRVTVGPQVSNVLELDYDPPSITSVNPSVGPTAGNVPITVQGNNFGLNPSVTIGGLSAPLASNGNSHTQLVVTLPAGAGANRDVVVSVGTQQSNAVDFDYAPPEITGISSASAPTVGSTVITLTGSNFGASGTVFINGTNASLTGPGYSDTVITCLLPEGQGANVPVIVRSGGQDSNAFLFSYDAPVISNVVASTAPTSGSVPITVQGSNFGSAGARVVLGTQEIIPDTSSHTALVFSLPAGQGANVPLRVSVGGQLSAATSLSYDPPVLTGISPAYGPTAGGTRLTLTGSNFGLTPSVSIGGRPASLAAPATHTSLEVDLPAGEGSNQPVLVTVDGRSSGALEFDYDPPVIQNVVASSFPTAGGSTVTLTGLNFGLDPSVKVNGIDATIVAGSAGHESVSFLLPAGQGTNLPVVLRAAGSNSAPVLISYDAPIIQQFSAASAPTAGGVTITIHGLNFGTSRIAQVGGNTINLQPASTHTHLVGLLPAGQGTNLPLTVSVAGRISNSLSFSYDAPLLTTVSPATGATAGGSLITLTGSNFGVSPMVFIGSKTAQLALPSTHNTIVVTSPAGAGAGLPVKVLVGDRFSNIGSFSYLPPTITSISPANGPIAGGTSITINGTNFGPDPTVSIGGKPVLQFDLQSHTRIVGTLPPGSGQNKPVIVTAEGQVSNVVFFSYDTEDFADWSASIQWNGLDSSPGADPRNNGWKNSLVYALGVDPTATTGGEIASRNPPIHGRPAFSRNAQGYLQLSFWRRRAVAYPDLIYQVEFSDGLGASTWEPASLAPLVEIIDDIWEFCTFTDHSGGAGRFGRVQIRIQP